MLALAVTIGCGSNEPPPWKAALAAKKVIKLQPRGDATPTPSAAVPTAPDLPFPIPAPPKATIDAAKSKEPLPDLPPAPK